MFVIQYATVNGEHKMEDVKNTGHRTALAVKLASFPHPIVAVYEQGTPITKAMRTYLRTSRLELNRNAREFMTQIA